MFFYFGEGLRDYPSIDPIPGWEEPPGVQVLALGTSRPNADIWRFPRKVLGAPVEGSVKGDIDMCV